MLSLKFWLFAALFTGLQSSPPSNDALQNMEQDLVRRVKSFQPGKLRREDEKEGYVNRERQINVTTRRKRKSFLDSILSKLKNFAKVTLSSRHRKQNPPSLLNTDKSDNSRSPGDHSQVKEVLVHEDHKARGETNDKNSANLGDKHVDTDDDSNDKMLGEIIKPEEFSGKGIDIAGISEEKVHDRSKEARGRSLWGVSGVSNDEVIKVVKLTEGVRPDHADEELLEEASVIFEQETRFYLHESQTLILLVSLGSIVSVVVVAAIVLLYRYSTAPKAAVKSCVPVPHVSSPSSPVSHKSDISYNSGGPKLREYTIPEDLSSLDSDYFLSSLEDITAQL